MQLTADTSRDRGRIFYLPWFTILCITDTVIIGFLGLMSAVFFLLYTICRQHIFQCFSVSWKTCDSVLKDGIVCSPRSHYVTLWQQRYASVVICFGQNGFHGKWIKSQNTSPLQSSGLLLTVDAWTGMSFAVVRKSNPTPNPKVYIYCIYTFGATSTNKWSIMVNSEVKFLTRYTFLETKIFFLHC